jgi:hypothetical protein
MLIGTVLQADAQSAFGERDCLFEAMRAAARTDISTHR